MKSKIVRKNGLFLFALVASACIALHPAQAATAAEKKAVMAAEEQFYSALNTMFTGDPGPMIKVWSHAADVTYMGPGGGFQVGWKKVLPVWKKQAAMKLGGTINPTQIQIVVGGNIAVVQNYENGKNTNAAGKPQKVSIRATNVFRNENGKWKMIAHHTDLLPYLAK